MAEDGGDSPLLLSGSEDEEPVARASDDEAEAQPDAEPDEAEVEADPEAEAEAEGGENEGGGDEDEVQMTEVGKAQQQPLVDMDQIQEAMAKFTPDQLDRYEHYRRAGFPKAQMRKLVQNVAGCSISVPMSIVMSGLAKMFVGDVVETARIIMTEQNEEGPIRPRHLRQAYRRLKAENKVPLRNKPRLFR